jgi:hypothetical protein
LPKMAITCRVPRDVVIAVFEVELYCEVPQSFFLDTVESLCEPH